MKAEELLWTGSRQHGVHQARATVQPLHELVASRRLEVEDVHVAEVREMEE
jgi:hypothetical protein